jgi:hypothetical protein
VEGYVQQIIEAENDAADALSDVLRRIPSLAALRAKNTASNEAEEAHGNHTVD